MAFDPETVSIQGSYRIGFLPPEAGSLAPGEIFVEISSPGVSAVPRLWVGVPSYGGVSGDVALLVPAPSGAPAAIALDPVLDPSPLDVQITGTVTPGAEVEVSAVDQVGAQVTPWVRVEGSPGTFDLTLPLPEGDGYTVHVRERAAPDNCVDSNTFSVSTAAVAVAAAPRRPTPERGKNER